MGDVSAIAEADSPWRAQLDDVIRWRYEELERAGYDAGSALRVAMQPGADLHVAVDLLRNGCGLETALRIVL
jgi:hypothetical protein